MKLFQGLLLLLAQCTHGFRSIRISRAPCLPFVYVAHDAQLFHILLVKFPQKTYRVCNNLRVDLLSLHEQTLSVGLQDLKT